MNIRQALAPMLLIASSLALVRVASAHHSTAMFEWGKETSLSGTVEKYQWTQPHTFLWVIVQSEQGVKQEWGLEGMSPSWLGRRGWSRHSISPGEKVSIVYYALKDHRPGGFYVRVKLADGRMIEALPQRGG